MIISTVRTTKDKEYWLTLLRETLLTNCNDSKFFLMIRALVYFLTYVLLFYIVKIEIR